MNVGVILVAAGQGTRLGADRPKALVPLHGEPIVTHALRGALACQGARSVVVVAPPGHVEELAAALTLPGSGPAVEVVPGGAERSASVARGLAALPPEVGIVLVHDAARALAPAELFDRVAAAVHSGHDAVVPGLPVTDTVKTVATDPEDWSGSTGLGAVRVTGTPPRSSLRAVQTPQGFRRALLERAHAEAPDPVTDDAGMVEQVGGSVVVVPGDVRAMKITTPLDLDIAGRWLDGPSLDTTPSPVLVVVGGLPGVGKTAVARELAARRRAAHLRVDTLEQAVLRAQGEKSPGIGVEGYAVGQALAADLLAAGLDVVADGTQRLAVMREAWAESATTGGARLLQVELVCGDPLEHRRRVEERTADIPGHRLPTWQAVAAQEWDAWPDADLCLDTARRTVPEVVDAIEELL